MSIDNLLENDEFKNKLATVESLEELASFLNAEGIQVSIDELDALMNPKEGELAEADLDMVSGGSIAYWVKRIIPFLPRPIMPRLPWRR